MSKKEGTLPLPCYKKESWDKLHREIKACGKEGIRTSADLQTVLTRLADASGTLKSPKQFNDVEAVWKDAEVMAPEPVGLFFKHFPDLCKVALEMPKLFREPVSVLKRGQDATVTLSDRQCLCLVAAGFLCALPDPPDAAYAGLSFRKFYRGAAGIQSQAAKLVAILYYFMHEIENAKAQHHAQHHAKVAETPKHEGEEGHEGEEPKKEEPVVPQTLYLRVRRLPADEGLPQAIWEDSDIPLGPVVRVPELDESAKADYSVTARGLQLSAHRPGAEVLALGADMDEVVFCEHPQLLTLLAFVEKLSSSGQEQLVIKGAGRYSVLSGQGGNLRCERGYVDSCPAGPDGFRQREICTSFPVNHKSKPEDQFKPSAMVADVNRYFSSLRAGYSVTMAEEEYEEEEEVEEEEAEEEEEGEGDEKADDEKTEDVTEAAGSKVEEEEEEDAEAGIDWDVAAYPVGVGLTFAGSPQLRALELWLACSQAHRSLRLRSPSLVGADLREEFTELEAVVTLLRKKGATVGQLFGLLIDDRAIFGKEPDKALEVLKSHFAYGV